MTISAHEARKRAEENLSRHVITEFIAHIDAKIQKAIEGGKFSVIRPFDGARHPSLDEKIAVAKYYSMKGYKYVEHPGDSREPMDYGYDELTF